MEVTGECMIWVELVSMHACLIRGACLMGLYSRWVELQGMNILTLFVTLNVIMTPIGISVIQLY